MANLTKKSFDTPDDLVAPDKTKAEILEFDTVKAVGVTGQFKATWGSAVPQEIIDEIPKKGYEDWLR